MGKKKKGMYEEEGITVDLLQDPAALEAYILRNSKGNDTAPQKVSTPPSVVSPKHNPISDGDYSRKSFKPSIASTVERMSGGSPVSPKSQSEPAKESSHKERGYDNEKEFAPLRHNLFSKLMTRTAYGPYIFTGNRLSAGVNYAISTSRDIPEYIKDSAYADDDIYNLINSFYTINKLSSEPDAVVNLNATTPINIAEEIGFCDNNLIVGFVNPFGDKDVLQLYILDTDYIYEVYVPELIDQIASVGGNVVGTIVESMSRYPSPFWVSLDSLNSQNTEKQLENFVEVVRQPSFKDATLTEMHDISDFVNEPTTLFEFIINSVNVIVSKVYDEFCSEEEDSDDDTPDDEETFEPFTHDDDSAETGGVSNDNKPFREGGPDSRGDNNVTGQSSEKETEKSDTGADYRWSSNNRGVGTPLGPIIAGLELETDDKSDVSSVGGGSYHSEEEPEEAEEEVEGRENEGYRSGAAESGEETQTEEPCGEEMVIPVTIVGRQ